jgi:hypothetical protein
MPPATKTIDHCEIHTWAKRDGSALNASSFNRSITADAYDDGGALA